MKFTKWRPEKRSYFIGILMGVMIGVGIGFIVSLKAGFDRFGNQRNGEVTLSVAVLRKLKGNDVESASRLLRKVIAINVHADVSEDGNWLSSGTGLDQKAIDLVNKAADEMPELKQAIEEKARN